MLNIESKLPKLIEYFSSTPEILGVWIIGSYGTEFQTEDSDIDLAILFDKDMSIFEEIDIEIKICEILETDMVDIVNLNKAPLTLQFKTISEGRQIFERDFKKVADFEEQVLDLYQDHEYFYKAFWEDFKASLSKESSNHAKQP
ncbi:DNA polymerase beta domain protein region [Caldicellulosiruptor kronotskyensis 2002]|uniref:DNA polymerase beta domain protein region n=1 Tax=Caldicellulosiruptor kronotskyensis (strain DSM 18902 / VKM B-2412 / 2002) TaxID=632348 RepID=E4SDX0_CALK2|nr:nucleotidyltransferase domain-containing protein [Caldicellulosiruptor kronotskyensis]ADQ45257.1 DNA polymerase beta domain protein region [Caldicellulosiruptor kronotskyensis 2002]